MTGAIEFGGIVYSFDVRPDTTDINELAIHQDLCEVSGHQVASMIRQNLLLTGLFLIVTGANMASADQEEFDPKSATIEELDARCEAAREKLIAPLRQAEIERCKADKRNDPAYCERFWKDYGESTVTADGVFVPRIFADMPECVVADSERRRRIRG